MQTRRDRQTRRTDALLAPANNFVVIRVQREVGRSNFGAHLREPRRHRRLGRLDGDYNRAYGVDTALQLTTNSKLFALSLAGTDSAGGEGRHGLCGPGCSTPTNNLVATANVGYTEVGDNFNPEVGYLPRRGYHFGPSRAFLH